MEGEGAERRAVQQAHRGRERESWASEGPRLADGPASKREKKGEEEEEELDFGLTRRK